ncbi:MAG: hypothetical protein P4N59_11820 [Negativicutes bacterium]|nr:hypothetical protein [Negativicutes bacterium]
MPAKSFICPGGGVVEISECLERCPKGTRCMILPTLRSIAASLNRDLVGVSVTELITGTRETYLKKTVEYAVDPQKRISALWGSGIHAVHEGHAYGDRISSEVRLYGEHCSGKYDLYGAVLDDEDTLADIKTTSASKITKALGMYKADVLTGELFKGGPRKGQSKTKKEWRTGGVRSVGQWSVQLNAYRMLLEARGLPVSKMVVQAIVRDGGARAAAEYGLDRGVYLIAVNKISDRWITRYLGYKAVLLELSLRHGKTPPPCNSRERWGGRKCLDFCEVADSCDHAKK